MLLAVSKFFGISWTRNCRHRFSFWHNRSHEAFCSEEEGREGAYCGRFWILVLSASVSPSLLVSIFLCLAESQGVRLYTDCELELSCHWVARWLSPWRDKKGCEKVSSPLSLLRPHASANSFLQWSKTTINEQFCPFPIFSPRLKKKRKSFQFSWRKEEMGVSKQIRVIKHLDIAKYHLWNDFNWLPFQRIMLEQV